MIAHYTGSAGQSTLACSRSRIARIASRSVRSPLSAILLALLLRLPVWLAAYPLHRDEALYGTWARLIASGRDPLLLAAWIDKPPLVLYLLAGSVGLLGPSELALRLPGMVASLLALACCYGLGRSAYGPRPAWLASLLYGVSPFAILFAPTAFTDPWLALWLLAGAWAALAGRPLAAGLALGLAVASKQQGALAAPLVVTLLLIEPARGRTCGRWARLAWALAGFTLVFAAVMYWDSLRWAKRPSFWDRSATTYGRLRIAAPAEWPGRAVDWGALLGSLYGWPALSAGVLLAAAAQGIAAGRALLPGSHTPAAPAVSGHVSPAPGCSSTAPAGFVDLVLLVYTGGYLLVHLLVTFQPWDRYLLPIVPLVALLAARGLLAGWSWLCEDHPPRPAGLWRAVRGVGPVVLGVLLLSSAWLGLSARLPVGSDHGAYSGLDEVIARLRAQPPDAVIYHQWIGWHYDYYLFAAPQERRWWGTPWKLADEAARTVQAAPGRAQWVTLPGWEDEAAGGLRLALASRHLQLAERQRFYRADGSRSFTLYEIVRASGDGR